MVFVTIGFSTLLLLLFSFLNPVQATPPVHWSQDAVNAILSRGGRTEIQVSLDAVQALGNIYLRVAPEIRPYVKVSPPMIRNVKAGDITPIRISIQAGTVVPSGLFNGTIQVVMRQGKRKVLALPLPVHVLIYEHEGGAASNVSTDSPRPTHVECPIAGVDADSNGVWDYIDQYIDVKYPGADNDRTRSACRQCALAIQGGLLNADNKDMSLRYATAISRAAECVFYLRPQDAHDVLSDLEAIILNTLTRSRAFLMFSEQCAGQVFPSAPISQFGASCINE